MESLIVPMGHDVQCVTSGKQALEIVRTSPPDLIILDVMMPELDGFTVCKLLKGDERTRLIPIIILSALNEVSDKVKALDCDADDFLSKPVNRHELKARIRSCLRIKALNDRLENSESVLFAFAQAVEAKDPYTIGHSQRVANFSLDLGKALGVSAETLRDLRCGGLLHDIGKIGVPDNVLSKPGKLSPEEFLLIQRHTIIGERICSPLRSLGGVLPLIRSHHERIDGSGYPDGLKGKEIPSSVQILSVADTFDALTSHRPYRSPVTLPDVERIFTEEAAAGRFDADLIQATLGRLPIWTSQIGAKPEELGELFDWVVQR
jgi:putative two-component system response regulator